MPADEAPSKGSSTQSKPEAQPEPSPDPSGSAFHELQKAKAALNATDSQGKSASQLQTSVDKAHRNLVAARKPELNGVGMWTSR